MGEKYIRVYMMVYMFRSPVETFGDWSLIHFLTNIHESFDDIHSKAKACASKLPKKNVQTHKTFTYTEQTNERTNVREWAEEK